MRHFWIPDEVVDLMMSYNQKFIMRFTTTSFTTEWQRLEIGIRAGCTISPIWFILTMELILRGTEIHSSCQHIRSPKKAFMDDIILTRKHDEMREVLERLEKLIAWARMKFKSKKSRSLVLARGKQGK